MGVRVPSRILPFTHTHAQQDGVVLNDLLLRLDSAQMEEYQSLERTALYPSRKVLFQEDEESSNLFRIVSGQVKISICSSGGRRLAFAIAGAGEFLDLASVITGYPYCTTAETIHPCTLAVISSQKFHIFLARHPETCRYFFRQLGAQYNMFCSTVRLIGLDSAAPHKLARLLLQWCETRGRTTADGVQINVSLTHEEIGEFIGSSRETVSRLFGEFRERRLVVVRGSKIIIPDTNNLEVLAMA